MDMKENDGRGSIYSTGMNEGDGKEVVHDKTMNEDDERESVHSKGIFHTLQHISFLMSEGEGEVKDTMS